MLGWLKGAVDRPARGGLPFAGDGQTGQAGIFDGGRCRVAMKQPVEQTASKVAIGVHAHMRNIAEDDLQPLPNGRFKN